jgi:two-component system, LytTR family, sensor kinase
MPETASPPHARPFRLLLVGATVLALLTAAQHWVVMQLESTPPSWKTVGHALKKEAPAWYLWVLVSPLVFWLVRRIPLRRGRLALAIPAHVVIGLALVLVHQGAVLVVQRLVGFPVGDGSLLRLYADSIVYRVLLGLLGYAILFGAVLAIDYYNRLQEREIAAAELGRQLAEARLQALRMQLNPHFLFNTMNTIAMLVRHGDNGQAVRMLADLSDILRHVLVDSPPMETPLRDELRFTERYLDLERVRFRDRLTTVVEVTPEAANALVPTLVLQPLVENAIKHGIARRVRAGRLAIGARRLGPLLELTVEDDGPGPGGGRDGVTPASGIAITSNGIGLANTASRLAQLYGERAELRLETSPRGGAIARVTLPFRPTPIELDVAGAVPS